MSIKLINLVWESEATRRPWLTPSEKSVFTQIANNANDDGLAVSLKVEAIIKRTNLDERTIQKAFRVLEERGFVSIKQRIGRVSHYQIHVDKLRPTPGETPGVVDRASREASSVEKSSQQTAASRVTSAARSVGPHVKSGAAHTGGSRSKSSTTPGTTPGVACGKACGSDIHTPGARPPAPGVRPPPPPALGHPPPASGHPSSLLLPSISPSLPLRSEDDFKKSGEGRAKKVEDREAPTPEELERRRSEQLERIREKGVEV